ncbi:hypothetical protein Droror1_Dr00022587 [Drosera rotundifolia]
MGWNEVPLLRESESKNKGEESGVMGTGAGEGSESTGGKKAYWRWSKKDFYPEPSFNSCADYKAAVRQTLPRLKDRLLDRSTETNELVDLSKESENPMKRCLTWWDLIWLSFGSVVGSGIFTITGQVSITPLSLLLGILNRIPPLSSLWLHFTSSSHPPPASSSSHPLLRRNPFR